MIGKTESSFRKLLFYCLIIFTMLYLFDRIIGIEYYENSNGNNIRKRRVKQLKRHNNINIDSEQVFNTLLNQP